MRAYFKRGWGHTRSEATTDLAKTSVIRLRRVTTHWRISLPLYELSEVRELKQRSGHTRSEATTDLAKLRRVTAHWRTSLPFYEMRSGPAWSEPTTVRVTSREQFDSQIFSQACVLPCKTHEDTSPQPVGCTSRRNRWTLMVLSFVRSRIYLYDVFTECRMWKANACRSSAVIPVPALSISEET